MQYFAGGIIYKGKSEGLSFFMEFKNILTTKRLLLREFVLADADKHYLLNSDPDVIQYTGDVAFQSIKEAEELLVNYEHYKKYGYGRWAVIEKETNEFLGWCGLKFDPLKNETDIGFRFFKKYWGNGYATEAALACINYGFTKLNLKRIVARTMSNNKASIKVITKLQMPFKESFIRDNKEWLTFEIGN
jgi:[ribosomal protein S5]-alanine N-acetyltransferase